MPGNVIEPRPRTTPALVRSCCEQHAPQARRQGLSLGCQIHQEAGGGPTSPGWHHAQGDPDRVRQILDNLLVNALKYTPSGGITVSLAPAPDRVGWADLHVRDTGPGIDAEQQARIFQPFVRLDDARRADREGSGLGLAIAARLSERLGGRIRVDGAPGQGSCFTVSLPLHLRH